MLEPILDMAAEVRLKLELGLLCAADVPWDVADLVVAYEVGDRQRRAHESARPPRRDDGWGGTGASTVATMREAGAKIVPDPRWV